MMNDGEMSARSGGSRDAINLDSMNQTELQTLLSRIQADNDFLQKENLMLKTYLSRRSVLMQDNDDISGNMSSMQLTVKKGRQGDSRVPFENRLETANTCLEELREGGITMKRNHAKNLETLHNTLEVIGLQLADCRADESNFTREFASTNSNVHISSEKYMRWFEEQMKQKNAEISKIRLRTSNLSATITRMQTQRQAKDESNEATHEIDFEQLKILNKQLQYKYHEKNDELFDLKKTTATTLTECTQVKLHIIQEDTAKLKQELNEYKSSLTKMTTEMSSASSEEGIAQSVNTTLRTQQEEFRVPAVLEYVGAVAQLEELTSKYKDMQRKLELAELKLKTVKMTSSSRK